MAEMVKESTCNSRDLGKKNPETLFWVKLYPCKKKKSIQILSLTNSEYGFICHGFFTEVFANKGLSSQGYGFSSGYVWMWELTIKKAEAPILWPHDAKSWLIWKDPDARKDWRREKKEPTEGEMFGWHHWLNGHEFE